MALMAVDSSITLDELAEQLKEACAEFESAARQTLETAIGAGEILLVIRERIPFGEWAEWLSQNFPYSSATATKWMRIAHYQDEVKNAATMAEAVAMLTGFPSRTSLDRNHEFVRQMAQDLRSGGLTYEAIGEELGLSTNAAYRLLNLERLGQHRYRMQARRMAAERALADEERKAAPKKAARLAGGRIGLAYSRLQQVLDVIDDAISEAQTDQQKLALREVRNHLDLADGKFNEALGLG